MPPGGPMGARPRSRPMARRGGVAAARQVITQLGAAEVPDPGPPPPHIIQCMQSSLAPPSLAQPCISGGELRESVQNVLHVSTSPGLQVSWCRCRLYLEMADDVPSIWAALSRDTAAQQRRGCQQTSAASISKVNQYEPRAAAACGWRVGQLCPAQPTTGTAGGRGT